ncbi:MAG: hypothetical protein AAF799_13695 [Myxococcota bacterium]
MTMESLTTADQAARGTFSNRPMKMRSQPCGKQGNPGPPPTRSSNADSWLRIELVDDDDEPCVGERFRVELPDGSTIEGTIGPQGWVELEGIDPGSCTVTFPRLDESALSRCSA